MVSRKIIAVVILAVIGVIISIIDNFRKSKAELNGNLDQDLMVSGKRNIRFSFLNNIIGWFTGVIAFVVYLLTMEPTVSWWDCGEYISTAYKLQVGHPPGAPLFQLLGRFFTLFAGRDVTKVAMMVNLMSCLCSALTITFLFWTITMLARKIWMKEGEDAPWRNKIGVLIAAFVGSMAYTFSESFWFNAVEGEVYAMSSFFTAVTFWAILKWEQVADEPHSIRWIIFIAYLIGLSIGVHLLNLLCIPAFVFVVYFKKWKKTTVGGFLLAGLVSLALLWFINMFLVPQLVYLAGWTELRFVNDFHLPFNSGTIFYFTLLIGLIVLGLILTTKYKKAILNAAILSFMFILIGYSSFFMLVIRANTNTPINENEPKDALSMLSYLNREQYGSWPLLYGPYYDAPIKEGSDGKPTYVKGKINRGGKEYDHYNITNHNKNTQPEYDSKAQVIFPRMWSQRHGKFYENYRAKTEQFGKTILSGNICTVDTYDGKAQYNKPRYIDNLKFFFRYQCNWMYWRYFMWNFVGRQNDIESQGEPDHGNWISGINFIDEARLGKQTDIPSSLQNPGRTKFYFLPLILGLFGLIWLLFKDPKYNWILFLLFFMTGLAIVIYLNQTPNQPRERDYSYAGSFYAFAIWIGFGVLAIIDIINALIRKKSMVTVVAVGLICFLAVPTLMAKQGWREHDRSGKTSARDWAMNYLGQLPPNAVIFTRGDNDTFPLWYIQEVEGFRTDVRVVNYMLSSGYWYAHQMARKVYESERLPLTLPASEYDNGVNESVLISEIEPDFQGRYVELKDAIDYFNSPKSIKTKISGDKTRVFPCINLKLTIDKEACIQNGIVPESMKDRIVDEIKWTLVKKNDEVSTDDGVLYGRVSEVKDTTVFMKVNYLFVKKADLIARGLNTKEGSLVTIPQGISKTAIQVVQRDKRTGDIIESIIPNNIRGFVVKADNNTVIIDTGEDNTGTPYEAEIEQTSVALLGYPSFYKNDLLLLDFMASNNWTRPVFFTSFSDMASVFGVQKYLHMEGLSYRFIPVKAENYYKGLGGVYREGSYDILVNKASWGNLNQSSVVPDRESVREFDMIQRNYYRLVQSLVSHREYESAVSAMDKYQEFFPNEKFPFEVNNNLYEFPEFYYKCGEMEKGDKFMMDMVQNAIDKVEYYNKMSNKFFEYYQEDFQRQLGIILHMQTIADKYKRKNMSDFLGKKVREYYNLFE